MLSPIGLAPGFCEYLVAPIRVGTEGISPRPRSGESPKGYRTIEEARQVVQTVHKPEPRPWGIWGRTKQGAGEWRFVELEGKKK